MLEGFTQDRSVLGCARGKQLPDSKPFSSGANGNTSTCLVQLWFRSQTRIEEGESVWIAGRRPGEESSLALPGGSLRLRSGHYLGFLMYTIYLWSSGSDFSRGLGLGQHGSHLPSVLGGAESWSEPLGTPWCGPG